MTGAWKRVLRRVEHGARGRAAGAELAVRSRFDRRRVGGAQFTVIANDCWGAEVYKHLRRPFNTPFIGLFVHGPCFVRLLANLEDDLSGELRFIPLSQYGSFKHPVATVASGAEIHFMHYGSDQDAREKWARRCARIDWEHLRVKFSDGKDATTPLEVAQVLKLRPEALVLSGSRLPGVVTVPGYTPDGVGLFRPSLRAFDLPGWLRGEPVTRPAG